jgi:protein-L-isoaspartate(D-aspartate) O-methyltransferase
MLRSSTEAPALATISAPEEETDARAKAAFLLRMRARGVQNLDILRALERVPRELFVPHIYADLARRDLAVPIDCGQTLSEPLLIARMIEALAPQPEHKVLEVGTGSGYATAVLGEIVRHVTSVERFQTLALAARLRLEKLAKVNVEILWGDGLAVPLHLGQFDRILVHGRVEGMPARLLALLADEGILIMARQDPEKSARQRLARVTRDEAGTIAETLLSPCRLQLIVPGLAQTM